MVALKRLIAMLSFRLFLWAIGEQYDSYWNLIWHPDRGTTMTNGFRSRFTLDCYHDAKERFLQDR